MSTSTHRGTKGTPMAPVIDLCTVGEVTFIRLDGRLHIVEAGAADQMLGDEERREEEHPS